MAFTKRQADKVVDQSLGELSRKGKAATSKLRGTVKGGAIGAGLGACFGAVGELGPLRRGDLSGRDFAQNRAVDASEGATQSLICSAASGAGAGVTTAALGTATGASAAASLGAAGTSALATISSWGTVGSAAAGALGGVTVAAAAPWVVGGIASLGAGYAVTRTFKVIRRKGQRVSEAEPEIEIEVVEAEPRSAEVSQSPLEAQRPARPATSAG